MLEGFEVSCVADGEQGLKKALNQPFDAIILDLLIPKLNGLQVLESIRVHLSVPIIILSEREDDIDHILALHLGADDYLTKPCNPHELIARLNAILKRVQDVPVHKPVIERQTIEVDCNKRLAKLAGQELVLTNAEFKILEMLIKSPGQAFSKEELTEYALARKYTAYDRSIDVHISNLRFKLGKNQSGEDIVKTVRGFGYMFND
jgi:two-component system response regulator CpxR